ncbi:MAG: hypothetical protein J7494_01805 [Sphingobium sp.]|nr:hypothetical protein [Sphingobium sp.]
MLSELEKLHADISILIEELERVTSEPTMRTDALAAARLNLTRVSRQRSRFLETVVYPALLRDCAPSDAGRVQALRDSGREGLVISAGHIAKWTLKEISERWSDYCAASRALRGAMRDRIREEKAVLYPLLRN